jgi:lysophospholipase L1-like esterase
LLEIIQADFGKNMKQKKPKSLALTIVTIIIATCLVASSLEHFADQFAKAQPIRVACVGDSITEGSGYPAQLQQLLGTHYRVKSFGSSGSTVSLESNRPYLNQDVFDEALTFQPSVVVIMLGTNDASVSDYANIENFGVAYKKIISQFQNLQSSPDLWLAEPPPIFNNTLNLTNENLVKGVIPQIQQIADELNLPVIDVHTPLVEYDEFFGDGVHPSSDGAVFIANEINDAITFNALQDEYP